MAGEFNPGFHQHQQQHSILYKPGGSMSNNSSGSGGYELISMANYYSSRGESMNLSASDGSAGGHQIFSSAVVQNNSAGPSSLLLMDSVPGLKHDSGLAVEWSVDEEFKLEEGLAKYADEPNIMRYIKIAASLQDKTVRDVALRCRWIMDKLMDASLKNNMSSASQLNLPAYSLPTKRHNQNDYMLPGVGSCTARHLLEENNHAFVQISANISALKLQENIDLFCRTRNNLTTVLNDMRNTPGIMSQMPPLPVLLNEELASSIFPHSSQLMTFRASSSIPMKQEPGC